MKELIQVTMNSILVGTFWSGSIKCFNRLPDDVRMNKPCVLSKSLSEVPEPILNDSGPVSKIFRS
jgi:hypothetical protein